MGTIAQALAKATELCRAGNVAAAEPTLRAILAQAPAHVDALYQLGHVLNALDRPAEAAECFGRVVQLRPESAQAHHNLAYVLSSAGQHDAAVAAYRRAIELRPDYDLACLNLGNLLARLGQFDEAAQCYERAAQIAPTAVARYTAATVLPVISQSAEQIAAVRKRLIERLQSLVAQGARLDPVAEPVYPPFYLVYQGMNDREVQELVARLCRPSSQDLTRMRAPGQRADARIRIGFVSEFFRDHTIGHQWQGVIAKLSRESFFVTVFSLSKSQDTVAELIRRAADRFVELPGNLAAARQIIAEADLDILVYTDVGMNRESYALAVSRLAPVQCAGWGHPLTTGLPTIDYYLSSELLETAEAEGHYTERLVRLKTLGLYLSRPKVPSPPKARADFGLPADKHLYGCLQSLFKLHPDDDALLAAILRRDPLGELVLLSGNYPHWDRLLQERMARSMPDCLQRIRFLPRQPYDDFLRLNGLLDVSLDPIHFSGGRTSYEALAMGTPVVTLPSPYLRGRITYGVYRAMGVLDCVAGSREQYVDLAVCLACDGTYRAGVRERILAGCDRIFDRQDAVRELEAFFREAAAR